MIPVLAKKITYFFIVKTIINSEDREVYEYSFEIFISTVLSLLTVGILSIITGTVPKTFLYLLAFIPLRQTAGGYHAKTHLQCFLIMIMVYVGFLILITFLPPQHIQALICIGIPIVFFIIFKFSPIDDPNKPIADEDAVKFKRKSRITTLGYIVMTVLMLIYFQNNVWAFSVFLGIMSVALSLLASVIKIKFSRY